MSKLVPWLKAHWPIPVLSVIALGALPTAMYFAAQMQEKFHADYQKHITDDANSVSSTAAQQKFFVPSWDGSGNVLERTGYEYVAAEYPEGHNWTAWAARIQDGIAWALNREP